MNGSAEQANAAARSAAMEGLIVAKWSGEVGQIGRLIGWLREARLRADEVAKEMNDRQEDWLVPRITMAVGTNGIEVRGRWVWKTFEEPHRTTAMWFVSWDDLATHSVNPLLWPLDQVAAELDRELTDV